MERAPVQLAEIVRPESPHSVFLCSVDERRADLLSSPFLPHQGRSLSWAFKKMSFLSSLSGRGVGPEEVFFPRRHCSGVVTESNFSSVLFGIQ